MIEPMYLDPKERWETQEGFTEEAGWEQGLEERFLFVCLFVCFPGIKRESKDGVEQRQENSS